MPKANAKRREAVKGHPGVYRSTDARGKVRHEFTYRDSDGRQRWERVQGGVRAADAARADKLARMGRGERVAPLRNLSFGDAADAYMQSARSTLRPGTVKLYESRLKNHLLPAWHKRRLDSLTVDDAARFAETMGETRKAWTVRGCLVTAGRIFDFASRRLGWAGQNPIRQLDRSERPRSDQRERLTFSQAELAALIRAADSHYRPLFMAAASTGLRLGELLGLRWGDLDFDAGTLTVNGQLDRDGEYSEPKTKRSRRTIELPAPVLSALRKAKLASEAPTGPDDYVFITRHSHKAHDHRNIGGRVLRATMKRATFEDGSKCWPQLSAKDANGRPVKVDSSTLPSWHGLRHGFAASWIASGGDVVELSRFLGHASPAVTASVYAGEWEAAARSDERRRRIEGMFGNALTDVETDTETNEGTKGPDAAQATDADSASVSQISAQRR